MLCDGGGMGVSGGSLKREWIYVYVWLIHVDVEQKVIHHCKTITLQLKNK